MVRALLKGGKTQTRRIIKRPLKHPGWTGYSYFDRDGDGIAIENGPDYPDTDDDVIRCPYGRTLDRLWVRESFWSNDEGDLVEYRATNPLAVDLWKPSIHMPRKLSRITLQIVHIACEQLQWINEAGAFAEGVGCLAEYRELWGKINGPLSWGRNPWVWVVTFDRVSA